MGDKGCHNCRLRHEAASRGYDMCKLQAHCNEGAWEHWQPIVETEAAHHDEGKCRVDLVPTSLIRSVADILAFGAQKYSEYNWQKGMPWRKLYGSIQRHMMSWMDKEDIDPESGLPHLAHAACDIAFLIEYAQKQLGEDNRP